MIITRSPLRISVGGGGTDLPSYYREHSGLVIAAAIDKYVYISLHPMFEQQIFIRYSGLERVQSIEEIQHPIVREALRLMKISQPYLQITSIADIPAGTGLGSSGSFTTALLKALHALKKNLVHPQELAEQACHIEIDLLKEPVGKQDQYIAAYGGITCFRFLPNNQVEAWPLNIDTDTRMAMTGQFRKVAQENPSEFDPRKFLKAAMDAMRVLCRDRFERFGTAGNASRIKVLPMAEMAKRYNSGSLDPQIAAARAA